jgi:hypothetical protein
MTDTEFWKCVGMVWIDSENLWQNYDTWLELWECGRPQRWRCMDKEEWQALKYLSNELEIFRGVHGEGLKSDDLGMSWTLDKKKAEWFASRYNNHHIGKGKGKVLQGTIRKKNVFAYFTGRNENEVVVDPCAIESRRR